MSQELPSALRVLRGIRDVPAAAWDALLDDAASPFLSHRYLSALEDSGCAQGTGHEARHLTLWRGARLVAAASAYLKTDDRGEYVPDTGWAVFSERLGIPYYPKLVLGVAVTPLSGSRLLVAPGENANA